MGTLPNANTTQGNGNTGRTAPSEDGVTLLVATGIAVGSLVLGTKSGPYYSLAEVEAAGVDKAYDLANHVLAWNTCKDFYSEAPNNTEMYLLLLANTVTLTVALDKTTSNAVAKAVRDIGSKVRLIGIGCIPSGSPTFTNQFEADLATAVPKAQELREYLFPEPYHTPVSIIIEGRNWQGNAGSTKDNHTFAAPRVSIVMSQDMDVASLDAAYAKHAHYGLLTGILARDPVQRNCGRVKSGATKITNPAFSNGIAVSATDATTLEALNAKGYIFLRKIEGVDGYYFNDDHTCAPLTDDYCKIAYGRVMDKASRIARNIYLQELNDEVELDPATGKLPVSVCKNFQGIIETAIGTQMVAKGEISGVSAYVNPAQDVAATDLVEVEVNIRKKGTTRYINATLAFAAFEG